MSITHHDYVPVLKWRQGEYQALMRLGPERKERVVPLIEVCPPEFDFETQQPAKSIDDHLRKFGPRLKLKWGPRPALIDAGLIKPTARMIGGVHPLTYLLEEARAVGGLLVPVTGFERDLAHYNAVAAAELIDGHGIAVRCSLDDVGDGGFEARLTSLIAQLGAELPETDIVVDLAGANLEAFEDLAQMLAACIQANWVFEVARSVTIIAAAFPASMGGVKGPTQVVPRRDWLLYKSVVAALPSYLRIPTFGDYAIAAPVLPQGDMRLMKPSATIRYTIDDAWLIAKGANVRDNGFEQYRAYCALVTNSAAFMGVGFSAGGDFISQCGLGLGTTGNLTTWRWVGTNHHIMKVVADLASFHAP
jgi:hypothetical protein